MAAGLRGLTVALLIACLCTTGAGCERTVTSDSARSEKPVHYPTRPNIVWLVTEDLGFYLRAFGDSTVVTPNLDALAAESVRYTRVYSVSGVCAPSRAAIATGMYPTEIGAMHMRTGPWYLPNPSKRLLASAASAAPDGVGVYEALPPPEVRLLSEYLRMAGYFATNNAKEDYQFRAPVTAWDESGPNAHWRQRAPGQPFFSVFNFNETHESRLFPNDRPLLVPEDLQVSVPRYLPDTEIVRRDVRRLYSNVLEMDARVEDLIQQLREDALLDETIVFWYADNGGPLPREKRTLYDGGIRVPLMIRFPDGWRAGEQDDRLISFVDFLPTVLSLAGIPPPGFVVGRAFLGAYEDPKPRQYVFAGKDRMDSQYDLIRAVSDGRFNYLRNLMPDQGYYLPLPYREQIPSMQEMLRLRDSHALGPRPALWFRESKPDEELFDTKLDPDEFKNLAGDSAYSNKLEELRHAYEKWSREHVDYGLLDESDYVRLIWPDGSQPVTSAPVITIQGDVVSMRSETPGALVGYQVIRSGEEIGRRWAIYQAPFRIADGAQLVAAAHRLGYRPSSMVAASR